jgi:hypothetical protein
MPPLKPLNFKFKYFYSSQNRNDNTSLLTFDMASNNKGGVEFVHQLVTLKGKQLAISIEILVICLSPSNASPT